MLGGSPTGYGVSSFCFVRDALGLIHYSSRGAAGLRRTVLSSLDYDFNRIFYAFLSFGGFIVNTQGLELENLM